MAMPKNRKVLSGRIARQAALAAMRLLRLYDLAPTGIFPQRGRIVSGQSVATMLLASLKDVAGFVSRTMDELRSTSSHQ